MTRSDRVTASGLIVAGLVAVVGLVYNYGLAVMAWLYQAAGFAVGTVVIMFAFVAALAVAETVMDWMGED